MIDKGAIEAAFNRIKERHPADERMLIAHDPADRIAVHHPDARGLILRRQVSEEFRKVCTDFTHGAPAAFPTEKAISPRALMAHENVIPRLIGKDARQQVQWLEEMTENAAASGIFLIDGKGSGQVPHIDRIAGSKKEITTIASYTDKPEFMTEWFPGTYTYTQSREIAQAFKNTPDTVAFKNSLGRQTLNPFDVLYFKMMPREGAVNESEYLLHSRPEIKQSLNRGVFLGHG